MKMIACTILCDCDNGQMFKTAIEDNDGNPSMFVIARGTDQDRFHFNTLVFDGYCNACGKRFQHSVLLESLLVYRSDKEE